MKALNLKKFFPETKNPRLEELNKVKVFICRRLGLVALTDKFSFSSLIFFKNGGSLELLALEL